jgi:CRP/FNR family transcriptional regulator, cyclic AMP receptor protein
MNRLNESAIRTLLREHVLLRDLPEDELDKLGTLAKVRTFDAGQTIFMKGDKARGMMVVLEGGVRIGASSPEGKEVVLNTIHPGEVFGEIALIDGVERTADAVTMEPTELLILDRKDFLPYLESQPKVCVRLLQLMCKRIRTTSEQLEDFSFLDLRRQIAKRLCFLAETDYAEPDGQGGIVIKITQHDLGAMMGTTREAVNKQLRLMIDEGLIEQQRGAIILHNPDNLNSILDEV